MAEALDASPRSKAGWLARLVKRGAGAAATSSQALPPLEQKASPKGSKKDSVSGVADIRAGSFTSTAGGLADKQAPAKQAAKQQLRSTKSMTSGASGGMLGDCASGSWHSITEFASRKEIGRGRNCIILSAVCTKTKMKVAIKAYDKKQLTPNSQTHIKREATLLKPIKHPSICQFYGAFEDATFIYIVMELCSRGDLMEMLVGEYGVGKLSEERAVQMVMVPLLSALKASHALGVVHRDIKPENLFLDSEGNVKLGDFGLAIDQSKERPKSRIGTLDYMAPEIFLKSWQYEQFGSSDPSAKYDEMVDIWACGVLAYEVTAGEAPFDAAKHGKETRELILYHEVPIKGKAFPPGASKEWLDFIKITLQKKPELRRSAEELLHHPWILKHSKSAAPAAPPPRPLVLDPIASSPPSSQPSSPTAAAASAAASAPTSPSTPSAAHSVSRFAKESVGTTSLNGRSTKPSVLSISIESEDASRDSGGSQPGSPLSSGPSSPLGSPLGSQKARKSALGRVKTANLDMTPKFQPSTPTQINTQRGNSQFSAFDKALEQAEKPWAIDGNDSPVSSLPNSPVTKVRKEPPHWQRSSWNGDKAADE
ncbi:Serine/threonine-protein kinase [Klebsormidium nitens]|uniref:Serine/threonine-protein kinase n=1 Tax=Klebsormidium nitens TaxID=105231 RepID=A0A1Y1HXJ8_KLENI|nr:Serine/threonine-protein kinase [Klebsormidium nitens]|eukprot:GAQ82883.1 Serine/threonine-protein kinase [Klebsormidium nitens]